MISRSEESGVPDARGGAQPAETASAQKPNPRAGKHRPPRPPNRSSITVHAALWSERADLAEAAMASRHLRPLWALPATELGVVSWPATVRERLFFSWNYWWQAHLIDCAIDAANRAPTPLRRKRVATLLRSHRLRNITGWTNRYYDDMAWLALAAERAQRTLGVGRTHSALSALDAELNDGWNDEVGAVPWRVGADYFNTPANGPAGIALLRLGHAERATAIADWLDATLRDPETGLILDGIHLPSGDIERPTFTYCQGVVLGLEVELLVRTGRPRHAERVHNLLVAIEEHLTENGVVAGGDGGDAGLFNGILMRYLALAVTSLSVEDDRQAADRRIAAEIVRNCANAAWANRLEVEGEPLFGHDWRVQAQLPNGTSGSARFTDGGSVTSSRIPERDLSVQLSGWMLMEAAHQVVAAGL